MNVFRALDFPLEESLDEFVPLLHGLGIAHRVVEEAGRQVLLVGRESDIEPAREAYRRWQAGELRVRQIHSDTATGVPVWLAALLALLRYPATLGAVMLGTLGYLLVAFDTKLAFVHWLSFSDFSVVGSRLVFEPARVAFARGEYWRLLTPIFLHFGILHVCFNLLWYWELGRRLERVRGSLAALATLLLTGLCGNIAQQMSAGDVLFGGLSGVLYGILGYAWMWNRIGAAPPIPLPPGILGFMLVWLLVCMSGLIEALGFGAIANAAHLAGLLMGMLLGVVAALISGTRGSAAGD